MIMLTRALPLRARFDDFTGYGQVSTELAERFAQLELGQFNLELFPIAKKFQGTQPDVIGQRVMPWRNHKHAWELLIYTLVVSATQLTAGKDTVFYTMWESTKIPPGAVKMLNDCALVLTPTQWCASVFSANGAGSNIRVVPLGINLRDFPERPLPSGPFTIGTAGRFDGGGVRKGPEIVVAAFQRAFPSGENVRLKIKASASCPMINMHGDSRVQVTKEHLTPEQLSAWYSSLHVFASGSACEGWGRHQHEAMATGRPVIGVAFGGVTEFWTRENGYAVEFDMVKGEGPYRGLGHYARPTVESMAEQMRRAFEDYTELGTKATLARMSAEQFDIATTASRIVQQLRRDSYL